MHKYSKVPRRNLFKDIQSRYINQNKVLFLVGKQKPISDAMWGI